MIKLSLIAAIGAFTLLTVATVVSAQVVFYEGGSSPCAKYRQSNANMLRTEYKADPDKNIVLMISSMDGVPPQSTVLRGCTVLTDKDC